MKSIRLSLTFLLTTWFTGVLAQQAESVVVAGLTAPVEVFRDTWGINHIYAKNQRDLFFAQGYCAARDRLFQFEVWRRQASGTAAEILGPGELDRDIGARLFRYRGDLQEEFGFYHDDGVAIIQAYVDGINAYIDEVRQHPEQLPEEFQVLGIQPGKWTPEIVISRHQGLKGNVKKELNIGRAVAKSSPETVKDLLWFHPKDPDLSLDRSITSDVLDPDILKLYNAVHSPLSFSKQSLQSPYAAAEAAAGQGGEHEGSNNWVISGTRTASGAPILANDPHRVIAAPSLRYMVHLVAPGWNVIGAGEPVLPGVSIGHNEHGAWGLTIFETDTEDLYVYDVNPDNLSQYRYKGQWVDMAEIQERISVKGRKDTTVTLRYTQHGPVTHIDSVHHKAYAVKCGWLEPGGAPYLASLRMNQATNWAEFRAACTFSRLPGENMIWADRSGDIGWQAVGIAPVRTHSSGLVPVPGDGRFEWDGYLDPMERPHAFNPEKGFWATANQHVTPDSYTHWEAIAYTWADPFRGNRINEVLAASSQQTREMSQQLQTDYVSIPARTLVPMLAGLPVKSALAEEARDQLANWDFSLDKQSVAAGIYVMWERMLLEKANERFVPKTLAGLVDIQLAKLITWLQAPDERFGASAERGRDEFMTAAFDAAIETLKEKYGEHPEDWVYGQPAYKHSALQHPLYPLLDASAKGRFAIPSAPRGGNGYTVNSTGATDNQPTGASFRMITDLSDWDQTVMINTPGQSGDPRSPYYRNLFETWANDGYFPAYFSVEKIKANAAEHQLFVPAD